MAENDGTNNPKFPGIGQVLHANNAGNIPPDAGNPPPNTPPNSPPNTPPKNEGGEGNPPNTPDPFEGVDQYGQKQEGAEEFNNLITLLTSNEDDLEDENKETRKQFLEVVGGSKLDSNGNLINEENKIVLTKQQLQKFSEDGSLPVDEKGNEVNNLGEVIRTIDEINKADSVVLAAQESIKNELGIELLDANGNAITYEDSTDGIVSLVRDAVQKRDVDSVKRFLNTNPVLNDVFMYLALGGDMSNYNSTNIDYKSIELKDLDKTSKLGIIKDSLLRQGLKDPKSMLSLIEAAGEERINQETANALLTLDALQTEESKKREADFKAAQQKETQDTIAYWDEVKSTVNKGKLGELTVPKADREEFFKYLAVPVDREGRSRDQIQEDNESVEFKLMVSFLRYKGYDLSKLAELMGKKQKVQTLRDKLSKGTKVVSGSGRRNTSSDAGGNVAFPTMKQIIGRK